MKRVFSLKVIAAMLLLSACVTINVYFPAAAAEKAADKIIEGVWGDSAAPAKSDKSSDKQSSIQVAPGLAERMLLAAASNVLDLIVPTAQAADADLNISTPAVRQITASMEARHSQLKKYYDSGAVGLTSDALVEVRDQNAVPLAERNAVRKLVAEENADRANLYRELASANGHPEWEADIRSTFAQRWIGKASPGWYVQGKDGNWKQK